MDTLTLKDLDEMDLLLKEMDDSFFTNEERVESWNRLEHRFRLWAAPLLSLARRQLEHEGKAEGHSTALGACAPPTHSDVPPLGEVVDNMIIFNDADFDPVYLDGKGSQVYLSPRSMERESVLLNHVHVRSLIAHLQSWLDTGSFELKPRAVESDVSTPATDQSTEGKAMAGEGGAS